MRIGDQNGATSLSPPLKQSIASDERLQM
jgi:hypothetical protein